MWEALEKAMKEHEEIMRVWAYPYGLAFVCHLMHMSSRCVHLCEGRVAAGRLACVSCVGDTFHAFHAYM